MGDRESQRGSCIRDTVEEEMLKENDNIDEIDKDDKEGDEEYNLPSTQIALLLLSDSALPLGSFAFSAGLESFLAHRRVISLNGSMADNRDQPIAQRELLLLYLRESLESLALTSLPFVKAGWKHPERIREWDDILDACTLCTVARRASISQGRALLSVWEKAFRNTASNGNVKAWDEALHTFARATRLSTRDSEDFPANGHFAPTWGSICRVMDLPLAQTAHLFLYNHTKALLSAAVRLSVIGPYQAQSILATGQVQRDINESLAKGLSRDVEDAGQPVPMIDMWHGRHELLYSRIFNS